jgi:hypothetical protein
MILTIYHDLRNICNSLHSVISTIHDLSAEITERNELQILRRSSNK